MLVSMDFPLVTKGDFPLAIKDLSFVTKDFLLVTKVFP